MKLCRSQEGKVAEKGMENSLMCLWICRDPSALEGALGRAGKVKLSCSQERKAAEQGMESSLMCLWTLQSSF